MRKPVFTESLNNAVAGITYALKTERNVKIHIIMAFCVLLMCLWLDIERAELAVLVISITMVIAAEIFNTAVEAVVNLFSISAHPLAKIAKDLAAGAVLVSATGAVFCGYIILFPAIRRPVMTDVVSRIKEHFPHIIIIIILLILIAVGILKYLGKKGSFTRGGLASGHAALSFGASTAILLITQNATAGVLALALALLVTQSRIEAKFHKVYETVIGGLIGILFTLMIFYFFWK